MKPYRKNILMIIPNLCFGGAQRSFNSLANELSKNHQVFVCVFNTINGIAYTCQAQIFDLKISGGGGIFSKSLNFFRRCKAINKLKKELKIDVSISYLEGANYINVLTKTKGRVVLSVRGSKFHDENIKGIIGTIRKQILLPIIYKYADRIVALNAGVKREIINRLNVPDKKVVVIRNFYNHSSITDKSQQSFDREFFRLKDQQYLIYAGRLAQEKGLKSIVDTYCKLLQAFPELRLVLLGDGPMYTEILDYVKAKFLRVYLPDASQSSHLESEQVIFTGYQDNPYKFISKASVLIIASTAEGGPNVIQESMICETLVVSTDCPSGPREVIAPHIDHGKLHKPYIGDYGILLPMIRKNRYEQTIHHWATVIEEYLIKEQEREALVRNAKKWVSKQSAKNIVEQWEKII